jgi:RNA polymerase sigma factor (sigma-70 family)
MSDRSLDGVVRHIRGLVAARRAGAMSDQELLATFAHHHDEAAFAVLLQRHGRMVLGVCRRALGHLQDAEDACQATFLILARKAGSIRKRESVASWLHGVAYRVAMNLRRRRGRRRAQAAGLVDVAQPDGTTALTWREVQDVLDEELERLPERLRVPLLLCYWEGKTRDEAAQELGWTAGTFRGRLDRGRHLLRARLTRRGVTLPAALLATAIVPKAAPAALPAALAVSTVKAAVLIIAGKGLSPGIVSAQVAGLIQGVLRTMFLNKVQTLVAAVFVVAVFGGGTGFLAYHSRLAAAQPAADATAQAGDAARPQAGAPADTGQEPRADDALAERLPVVALAFSPDGKLLAAATGDGSITIWDVASGKEVVRLQARAAVVLRGAPAGGVAFAPDGKRLASAGPDDVVRLWDAATGKLVFRSEGGKEARALAFSPDGKLLVTSGTGAVARVWDAATGQEVRHLAAPEGGTGLAFSPDGKVLAIEGGDKVVRLWDLATGKELRRAGQPERAGARARVGGVAFSPDGKRLAVSGPKASVWLLDVETGRVVAQLNGHDQDVTGVAFSADGRLLASAGADKTVRLWDVATGKEVAALKGHRGAVSCVQFSPDGTLLASGSQDGTVKLWDVPQTARVRSRQAGPHLERVRGTGAPVAPRLDRVRDTGAGPQLDPGPRLIHSRRIERGVDSASPAGGDRLDQLLTELANSKRSDAEVVDALCLATLGRLPTETEKGFLQRHLSAKDRREALADVLHALTNTKEFRAHVEALRRRSAARSAGGP